MFTIELRDVDKLVEKLGWIILHLPDALERELDRIGTKAVERARLNAPILTGELRSMIIHNVEWRGGDVVLEIYDLAPYAIYMHEGFYNLGPVSAVQPSQPEGGVGRKYLERVMQFHAKTWERDLADVVSKAMRG